jgi:hypothetical protein
LAENWQKSQKNNYHNIDPWKLLKTSDLFKNEKEKLVTAERCA